MQIAYQSIFKQAEQKAAVYVFGAQKSEIDTPLHLHSKGQLTYADHGPNPEMPFDTSCFGVRKSAGRCYHLCTPWYPEINKVDFA